MAFDNVSECRDLLSETLQLVLVITILDGLHLLPRWMWLERWLDHVSIQATLVSGRASTTAMGRLGAFLRFHKRIAD